MTKAERLAEAEDALHRLLTGAQVASARDTTGRQVTYTQATRRDLEAYIAQLKAEMGTKPRRALKVVF